MKKRQTTIPCSVSAGMFSNEKGVSVDLPDGRKVSAFVDRRDVIPDRDIKPEEEYPGYVKVSVVEIKKDYALIDLPQPGLTEGPRLTVPKKIIKTT